MMELGWHHSALEFWWRFSGLWNPSELYMGCAASTMLNWMVEKLRPALQAAALKSSLLPELDYIPAVSSV